MYYVTQDYLMHYGILGQKWGVRRFQNPDGTRTNAGKRRRERSEEEKTATRAKVRKAVKIGAAATGAAAVAGASAVGLAAYAKDHRYTTVNSSSKKSLSDYSDEELKATVQRQNLEKKYKDNTKDTTTQDVLSSINQINNASMQGVNHVGKIAKAAQKEAPKPDYSHLSDDELRRRINRLQMEKQYSQLSADNINAGRRSVDKAIDIAGGVVGLAGTAATIALAIHTIYKKV